MPRVKYKETAMTAGLLIIASIFLMVFSVRQTAHTVYRQEPFRTYLFRLCSRRNGRILLLQLYASSRMQVNESSETASLSKSPRLVFFTAWGYFSISSSPAATKLPRSTA
jgi:hypothetical protein